MRIPAGLKPKDLVGIPWRVAFALQADGWWLRQDIIWHKPNPMPESVTDRCTKAHEYVFLLSKSERYYWDAEAVKEPSSGVTGGRFGAGGAEVERLRKDAARERPEDNGTRNRRSVWTISTKPYKGAHFATMPPALVEPCILAGTSERGCCPACGKPWERVVERGDPIQQHWAPGTQEKINVAQGRHGATSVMNTGFVSPKVSTGWRPGCECGGEPVPCVVLDPFLGSGTVVEVANKLGRIGWGIELNAEYVELAKKRIDKGQMRLIA